MTDDITRDRCAERLAAIRERVALHNYDFALDLTFMTFLHSKAEIALREKDTEIARLRAAQPAPDVAAVVEAARKVLAADFTDHHSYYFVLSDLCQALAAYDSALREKDTEIERLKGDAPRHALRLPDCMMPDGAEPCAAYSQLYEMFLGRDAALSRFRAARLRHAERARIVAWLDKAIRGKILRGDRSGAAPLLARIEQQGMAIAHQREELRRLRSYNMQAAAVMLRDPPGLIIDAIFDTGIALSLNDVRAICAAIADVIQSVPPESAPNIPAPPASDPTS